MLLLATPICYDPNTNYFNTKSIETAVYNLMSINPTVVMGMKFNGAVDYTD